MQSTLKRLSQWMLPVLLVVLSLSGCARSGGGDKRDAQGRVVIDFWNGFTGPDGKTMEKIVKKFERDNPDIKVKMQIIPWGTYYDKVTLALAYGGAPDVFVMHAERLPEFASFHALHPLDALAAADKAPLVESDFAPAPWKVTHYKGQQVALPLDVHPVGLYYNAKLFREAGIVDANGQAQPPRDWNEFLADCRKLTKDTNKDGQNDQWGFAFTNLRTNFLTFAGQTGGEILQPDGKHSALDSPGNVRALQMMHDVIYKYKVAPHPEDGNTWEMFRQGKAAMVMEGIYMLASLEETKGLDYAGAPVPHFGPKPAVSAGSHTLCQPADISPAQSKAAWRLMRYLSDHSIDWARGGQVPTRIKILQTPEFRALKVQSQFAQQLPYVKYTPDTPKLNALYPFLDPAIDSSLRELQTPQEAVEDATHRINQVLQRP